MIMLVIGRGIHSGSDTNRNVAEGLSFYYFKQLYCPDQMPAVMLLKQHWILHPKLSDLILLVVPDVWGMQLQYYIWNAGI